MYLALRAHEGDETIIGRDFKRGTNATALELIDGLDGRCYVDDLASDHVIVIEALVSRAKNDFLAVLCEMSSQYRILVDEYGLNLGVFLSVNLRQ